MPKIEPMSYLLSVFGIAGLTAYFGLLHIGKPKEGETVVVSAARARSAPSSARSPKSGLPRRRHRRRQGQVHWLTSELGSTPRSITRTAPPSRRCALRRRKASTSISTMSAATSWKPASPR